MVRGLIRRQQESEQAALEAEFEKLSSDGEPGEEPVEQVMEIVQKVKMERREAYRGA